MKKRNVFSVLMMMVLGVSALVMASCVNDDPTDTSMQFNNPVMRLYPDSVLKRVILYGTAPYKVVSSDSTKAIATVSHDTVSVKGYEEGNVTIVATDNANHTASLLVSVFAPLKFDQSTVTVNKGETAQVKVTTGKAPYKVYVQNTKIVQATIADSIITLKGLAAGTSQIAVVDSRNVDGQFKVTVK